MKLKMDDNIILGGLLAALGIFSILIILVIVIFLVFYIIGRWNLFKKAGKNGWEAIIPFYNDWVYVEIAGLNYWWFFLVISNTIANFFDNGYVSSIASICSIIGLFVCNYNISKKLHKDTVFAVLMTIFPFILIPMIGLSSSYKWDDSVSVSSNGPFNGNMANDKGNNTNNYNYQNDNVYENDYKYCSYCGTKVKKSDKFCGNCGREI